MDNILQQVSFKQDPYGLNQDQEKMLQELNICNSIILSFQETYSSLKENCILDVQHTRIKLKISTQQRSESNSINKIQPISELTESIFLQNMLMNDLMDLEPKGQSENIFQYKIKNKTNMVADLDMSQDIADILSESKKNKIQNYDNLLVILLHSRRVIIQEKKFKCVKS